MAKDIVLENRLNSLYDELEKRIDILKTIAEKNDVDYLYLQQMDGSSVVDPLLVAKSNVLLAKAMQGK